MTVQVVDGLEAVEVDGQDRELRPVAIGLRDLTGGHLVEQRAVAQIGQRIVIRVMLRVGEHARSLADRPPDRGRLAERRRADLDRGATAERERRFDQTADGAGHGARQHVGEPQHQSQRDDGAGDERADRSRQRARGRGLRRPDRDGPDEEAERDDGRHQARGDHHGEAGPDRQSRQPVHVGHAAGIGEERRRARRPERVGPWVFDVETQLGHHDGAMRVQLAKGTRPVADTYFTGPLAGVCSKTSGWSAVFAGSAIDAVESRSSGPTTTPRMAFSDARDACPAASAEKAIT